MPGRIYPVPFTGTYTNAGGDVDLLNIAPADDKPCKLVGWSLGQSSEVKDAEEEGIRLTIRRITGTITDGTGGSSVTMTNVKLKRGNGDAAFTARINDTGVTTQTGGTDVILEEHSWINRNTPWVHFIPEEMRPDAIQGERLIVRGQSTIADDMTVNLTFWVEEEG